MNSTAVCPTDIINELKACYSQLNNKAAANLLTLNSSKTEFVLSEFKK